MMENKLHHRILEKVNIRQKVTVYQKSFIDINQPVHVYWSQGVCIAY